MPSKREQENERIKQRERDARASRMAHVPNLASRMDVTSNSGGSRAEPGAQSVGPSPGAYSVTSAPAPSTATTPEKNVPPKMTRQEEELMIKQRERQARNNSASTTVVPNLASRMSDNSNNAAPGAFASSAATTHVRPGAQAVGSPAAAISAVPKKMTRQEEELMIKQRARAARTMSSRVITNLASVVNDGPTEPGIMSTGTGARNVRPGAQAVRPGAQAVGPPASAAPRPLVVPKKVTRQEQELLIKQRERAARTMSNRVFTKNLASMVNDAPQNSTEPVLIRPGAQTVSSSSVQAPASRIAVPKKMSRQEEELMIKQRERDARTMSSHIISKNLASMVNDAPQNSTEPRMIRPEAQAVSSSSTRAPVSAAARAAVPKKMTRQEEELMTKQRELEARGAVRASMTSVVPNLARMVTQQQVPIVPAYASASSAARTTREEEMFLKQRELEARGAVVATTTTSRANSARSEPSANYSLQARYNAAAAILGDDGEALMRQESLEVPRSAGQRQPSFRPESENTVRARYQAATLAMGDTLTQEEEDRQLKERERQMGGAVGPQRFPSQASVASSMISSTTSAGMAAMDASSSIHHSQAKVEARNPAAGPSSQQDLDLLSKSRARGRSHASVVTAGTGGNDTADVVVTPVNVGLGNIRRVRDDALAKSRGRRPRGRATSNANLVVGEATVEAPIAVISPGAYATNMGEAERLQKPHLPQQPVGSFLEESHQALNHTFITNTEGDEDEGRDIGGGGMIDGYSVGKESAGKETDGPYDNDDRSKQKTAPSRRRMYWIIGIILVVAIAGGIGGALAGGGGDSESDGPADKSPQKATDPPVLESKRLVAIRAELSNAVSSANSLEDTSSPQYKALDWIADQDRMSPLDQLDKVKARYVLAVFYYSLRGPSWTESGGWLGGTDECTWDRLECDEFGLIKIIQEEKSVNIGGTIPSELQHLSGLEQVFLSNNPVTIGDPLSGLKILKLESSRMTGEIPSAVYEMTDLEHISFIDNALSGIIPFEIGNLSKLTTLDLGDNDLSGTLTTELHPLKLMKDISLASNNLEGQIMEVLAGFKDTDIRAIYLRSNSFSGEMDNGLASLTGLQRLEVASNDLSGPFPNVLSSLSSLGILDLSFNSFTGFISTDIGNLSGLQKLLLLSNQLSSTIPTEIGLLRSLNQLNLEINRLEGPIPTEIGNLRRLNTLSLQINFLTGTIPVQLAELNRLDYLLLDNNLLTGTVPSELQELRELIEFRLGRNYFTGSIPTELCDLPNLQKIVIEGTLEIDCVCAKCHV